MISATIITLKEEKNIRRALKSLEGLGQEIVLVDCGSTDKTISLAKEFKAKIFFREFDNFANQKNWAASKVKGDWILSIDADEEIPKELAEEIKKAVKVNKYDGYLIPRRNLILGKEIKHSRWNPDQHIWLWKKKSGIWKGEVHEEVEVNGAIGKLNNCKIHYSHETVSEIIKSNNFYSTLLAASLFKEKVKFSLFKMFWKAFFEFNVRFIYKKGFLDGWRGFVLAYLMAVYQLMVFIKLWELEQKK